MESTNCLQIAVSLGAFITKTDQIIATNVKNRYSDINPTRLKTDQ